MLDLAGNNALSFDRVLLSLRGLEPEFNAPELNYAWSETDVDRPLPLTTLESITLGIRSSKNQVC